jgi:capsular polysaccharide biosynthesis protein
VDILSLLKIIIRRWIVVMPVIGIVLATGFNTIKSLKPEYKGSADLLLFAPTKTIDPITGQTVIGNPFKDFSPGLNTTGTILQTIVLDGPHHEALSDQNLSTDYDVTVSDSAPIMSVTANAERPDVADATVAAVVNSINAELQKNQDAAKVSADARVNARLLTVGNAYLLTGDRTRVAAAIAAVGLAAIIGAALVAESVASSMAKRKAARQESELAPVLVYPAGTQAAQEGVIWQAAIAQVTVVPPPDDAGTGPAAWPSSFQATDTQAAANGVEGASTDGQQAADGGPRRLGGARTGKGRTVRRPTGPAQPPVPDL